MAGIVVTIGHNGKDERRKAGMTGTGPAQAYLTRNS
jgi:hypothetical protein